VDSYLNHQWHAFRWALLEFTYALVLSVPNFIKDIADVLTRIDTMRAAFGPEGLHNVCRRVKTSNSWLVHWVLSPTHELAWIFICSISKGDHDIPSSWSCGLGEHDEIMQIMLSYASVLYSDPSSHRGPVLASLGAEGPSVSAKSCQNVFIPVDSWVLVRLILLMNFQCK
jgi:hypothetical protein